MAGEKGKENCEGTLAIKIGLLHNAHQFPSNRISSTFNYHHCICQSETNAFLQLISGVNIYIIFFLKFVLFVEE